MSAFHPLRTLTRPQHHPKRDCANLEYGAKAAEAGQHLHPPWLVVRDDLAEDVDHPQDHDLDCVHDDLVVDARAAIKTTFVIPAEAGTQRDKTTGPRFRGDDEQGALSLLVNSSLGEVAAAVMLLNLLECRRHRSR